MFRLLPVVDLSTSLFFVCFLIEKYFSVFIDEKPFLQKLAVECNNDMRYMT